jgi:hypothetical protein
MVGLTMLNKTDEEAQAIAGIEKLGGKVHFVKQKSGRTFVKVNLGYTRTGDEELKLLKHLKYVKFLSLNRTKVTDKGLEHPKGLVDLQALDLQDTMITDKGLNHLKGLADLRSLDLDGTKATKKGVKKLKELLPTIKVIYGKKRDTHECH